MEDLRQIACEKLEKVLKDKVFFEKTDNAFVNMLVLTALRHLGFTEKFLKQIAPKKSKAKICLLCGITELLFLDSPQYAVVNSYVEIIKKKFGKFSVGFANAVLHSACRQKENSKTVGGFFNKDFAELVYRDYGKEKAKKIELAAQVEPALDITVKNNFRIEGAEALPNGSLRLSNVGKIENLSGYSEGLWWVQDAGATLAVQALGSIKDKKVLDLCAAPGGKTAQLINAGAIVTAVDIDSERLKVLEQNLTRLNLQAAKIVCQNGLKFCTQSPEKFDIILLDAPCSATGTLRRHPEIAALKNKEDIKKQTIIQQQLLEACLPLLSNNGILLYCTCSLFKAEGEEQIAKFAKRHSNLQILPLECKITEAKTIEGYIRTLPYMLAGGIDSFFVAGLRKREENDQQ